ncbi:bifunctional DedA family/phosphatase PAP2 family protein [Marilutibacter chinensis]|uniref:Bifunctional DedA family/phosphatase PAP2 family protein n=1 Tax=Marilutibacter chinensis TaxID=2912247 RepID=A0ABS9HYQ6_9GAMM|nr:bifunctional DedA family/phosphatase PAP2 family protein [Lysobacter chinensis]MCF7223222.1 bifunctional DedA family/phosphatase PAP2 family protein [Lysobacter chinensis]
MDSAWIESATAWIAAHPIAAGAVIFLIAFCDALVILGIFVPALPLLFAVGALVGLGHINGPYALAAASAGAFLGDALSYWIGRNWGPQLRQTWPFSRYPQWLDRGEGMFRRRGAMSIVIARFVGAVRPFVPAIAGMLRMPFPRYLVPSLAASIAWAALFLAPGWVLGASYDAVAAVADRLAIVLGTLAIVLALVWAAVLYTWRWFAAHADNLLARGLSWTRTHPRLGRYAAALVDPNRPESPSLVMLAVCLLAISWAWFTFLAALLASGGPLALDQAVHGLMWSLRNPLADHLMAGLASLGDTPVLGTAAAVTLVYLLWRRRWMAAAHWIAAIVFGLVLTALLETAIEMPRPPTAPAGFGFPSVAVTMTTVVFGFFAVLISRELPGRKRVWPYLVAGVATTLVGFARLYLGAHWLSDLIGGSLFGILWLLALGLAYRSHVARSFWMRPLAWMFYGSFLAAALWHAPRAADGLLAKFETAAPLRIIDARQWWNDGWSELPGRRDESDARRRWLLDLQVAGPLEPLRAALEAEGWRVQPQADWTATIGLLDDDIPPIRQPVLPATLDARAETLLMLRDAPPGPDGTERLYALRLWPAPAALDDGSPLWLGSTQRLHLARPLDAAALWRPEPDDGESFTQVREALSGFSPVEEAHPATGLPVLRLRTAPDPR